MPDPIAGKRLKKKMLDRWENEGGRIAAEVTTADDDRPTSEAKAKKRSSSRDSSKGGVPVSPKRRRKPNQK